jgi:hypothetical protein
MTQQELKILEEDYNKGLSLQQLGKKYGWNSAWIHTMFRRNNISIRDLSKSHIVKDCDYSFFSKIDNEAKAYFLGFLYADGSITHNSMKLTLHKKDFHILKDFKKAIGSAHAFVNDRGYMRFCINNKQLYNDLLKQGCGHKKSLTLKFPTLEQVPKNLLPHFIRGFFDGDGSINYSIDKKYGYIKWRTSFISTIPFNQSIQNILGENIESSISFLKLSLEQDNKKLCYLSIGGNKIDKIQKIYYYLYNDASIFLKRKKGKFEEIFRLLKANETN